MNTEIYYGKAGTGKTSLMLKKIKEQADKGNECILFVPEQFSFDAERQIYFAVGAKSSAFVKVTGFSKLSRQILKEYKLAKPCADNAVKLITMWQTVENARADFLSFGNETNSPAFCANMLKTVAALRNGGISPESLRQFLSSETSLDEDISDKAGDILRIYTDYDRALTENLDDKLDDVSRAAEAVAEHDYFRGKYLFFDNYDSFSAVQKKMLSAALGQAEGAILCFTSDKPQSDKMEFLCVSKTINELLDIAPEAVMTEFKEPYRAKEREETEIYSAESFYGEADLIAAKIHRMVREENYRYRDFLVLTADREHEPVITAALERGGIPVFCDFPHSMTEKPVIGFILQIFAALDFDTDEVLKLAESGFKRIYDKDRNAVRLMFNSEIYRLRLAADRCGITAADWIRDWSNDPRKELREPEEIREGIISPLQRLKVQLEEAENGEQMSEIFMNYLFDSENIRSTFIAGSKAGQGGETYSIEVDERSAEEYSRIWEALCDAITSMAYCLENEKISYTQYGKLLAEILKGINLANPPAVLDSVTVGDIERTRKSEPKVVFIAGVNQGNIPRESHLQSAFSYFEREKLGEAGLQLYDSNLNRCSKEHYFLYRAMEMRGKKLILTYSSQGLGGEQLEAAQIFRTDKGLCNIPHIEISELPYEYFLNTAEDVKAAIAASYSEAPRIAEELENILNNAFANTAGTEFKEQLRESDRLLSGQRKFTLTPETAKALFNNSEYSPTRLETAFDCPFLYFCTYGLKIRRLSDNDPEAANNIGTAVHNILNIALSQSPRIAEMNDEELAETAKRATDIALRQAVEADPAFPEKTEAVYRRFVKRIELILKQLKLDCMATGFEPFAFEKRVSYRINNSLFPSGYIEISGTADRIDIRKEGNAAEYIRICDYKTSGKPKTFTLDGIESGKNLQPLLYLFAECNWGSGRRPAAVNYVAAGKGKELKAKNSLPLTDSDLAANWYDGHLTYGAAAEKKTAEAYKALNKNILGQTGASRKSYVKSIELDESKFGDFKEHIEQEIITPKITSLLEGNIEALPLEHEEHLPCEYCDFKSVCGNRDFNKRSSKDTGKTEFLVEK